MLQVDDLTAQAEGQLLLNNVSVSFPAGKTTVLIGGSGSGKSLLLKTAALIRPPEAGRVVWGDEDLTRVAEERMQTVRRRWGVMFQDSALWANMSVFENLALPIRFHNPDFSQEQIQQRIDALTLQLGFEERLDVRPVAYSAGKQKIIAFMRCIANDPELVFLDEPSTFVDRSGFMPIYRVLQRYRREQRTIIMVTHDIELAKGLGDYMVIVRSGEIAARGPLQEMLQSHAGDIQREIHNSFEQGGQE